MTFSKVFLQKKKENRPRVEVMREIEQRHQTEYPNLGGLIEKS